MIISASRRTDIPAFYSEWLVRRLQSGEVMFPYVRNPGRLGLVRLSPAEVDCIVFWTKNAAPLLERLDAVDALGYAYYFLFTLNAYGSELERNLPPRGKREDTFRRLSDRIGAGRVDWRYDPIIIDEAHTIAWQLDQFGALCATLSGYTERCIMNFIKPYRRHGSRYQVVDDASVRQLAQGMASIAVEYRIPLYHCTSVWDLQEQGILACSCIDRAKIEMITGYPIAEKKDPGQPGSCLCLRSIDIGVYDSCSHGCDYCYAVSSERRAELRRADHDAMAPMLSGYPRGDETIFDRSCPSCRVQQLGLFSGDE